MGYFGSKWYVSCNIMVQHDNQKFCTHYKIILKCPFAHSLETEFLKHKISRKCNCNIFLLSYPDCNVIRNGNSYSLEEGRNGCSKVQLQRTNQRGTITAQGWRATCDPTNRRELVRGTTRRSTGHLPRPVRRHHKGARDAVNVDANVVIGANTRSR